MIKETISRLIKELRITEVDRKEVDQLISDPVVQDLLDKHEAVKLAKRRALIKELNAMPRLVETKRTEVEKAVLRSLQRLEEIELKHKAAIEELKSARNTYDFAGYAEQIRVNQIKKKLIEAADPRIEEFRFYLSNLEGRLCMKLDFWIEHTPKNYLTGKTEVLYKSNSDDVHIVRDSLKETISLLEEMKLSALSTFEVTQALADLSARLKASLDKVGMRPPTLDENSQIKPPLRDDTLVAEVGLTTA
jgi:hypothetical protein